MKPHNPGMSEAAWKKLHKLVARLIVKYQDQLKKKDDAA